MLFRSRISSMARACWFLLLWRPPSAAAAPHRPSPRKMISFLLQPNCSSSGRRVPPSFLRRPVGPCRPWIQRLCWNSDAETERRPSRSAPAPRCTRPVGGATRWWRPDPPAAVRGSCSSMMESVWDLSNVRPKGRRQRRVPPLQRPRQAIPFAWQPSQGSQGGCRV